MKIFSSAIHLVWLIVLVVLSLASPIAASEFSSAPVLFAYDGQNPVRMAYDGGFLTVVDYDSAAVLSTTEEAHPTLGASSVFGKLSKFLAAESTAARATQLEFNFAKDFGQNSGLVIGRGRDLAMPGALGPGEYKLGWFSVQETSGMDAEWAVNQSKLQNVMNLNLPIRDASSLQNVGGFYLNNERGMLQSAGWNYQGGYWVPPAH